MASSHDDPSLQEVIDALNQFGKKLDSIFSRQGNPAAHPQSDDTAYEKVVRFLESKGNVPQSTAAIRAATGVSRGGLAVLLYTTHKDEFVSEPMPGKVKKKLWSLRNPKVRTVPLRDMAGRTSVQVCRKLLLERDNAATHVLTLAKEALKRGYKGRAKTSGDALEFTTATGFWARLSRDHVDEFEQVRDKTFRLRDPERSAQILKHEEGPGSLFD